MSIFNELLLDDTTISLTELFDTSYSYKTSGQSYSNFYNNWDWYSEWGLGNNYYIERPNINGSEISMNSDQGAATCMVRLTRSLEGYSTSRPFKAIYSYTHRNDANNSYNAYSDVVVSIGGNSSLTGIATETYGLAYHSRYSTASSSWVKVKNNGSVIGTPYSSVDIGTKYYNHIFYDGTNLKITRNTSANEVTSYDYSYTVTDKTQLSTTLMIYCYAQGYGDYSGGVKFHDIDLLLY